MQKHTANTETQEPKPRRTIAAHCHDCGSFGRVQVIEHPETFPHPGQPIPRFFQCPACHQWRRSAHLIITHQSGPGADWTPRCLDCGKPAGASTPALEEIRP